MDGLQEGTGIGEEGAAQGGTQQQAAQAQVTGGSDSDKGDNAAAPGGTDARADYETTLAERDARIAELEGQIAEAAKKAESAERLRAEMDELRRKGDEERVGFELQIAGARNVKAARALLSDYDNDVDKLKAAEPWLFGAGVSPSAQAGATGLPNAGAATDEGAQMRRWRAIAGIEGDEE